LAAIQGALDQLKGIGNVAAWKWIHARVPRKKFDQSLAGLTSLDDFDAVNDLGTDSPRGKIVTGRVFLRDPRIRKAVLKRAGGKCELCGKSGFLCSDGSRYLEAHHIIALADDGPDRMSNVIALCADHHREAHLGRGRSLLEARMILIVQEQGGRQQA
jgi:predicted restriction endonuclease